MKCLKVRPGQFMRRNERKIGEFLLNKLSQRPLGDRDKRVINYPAYTTI